jgi:hypothetical protein
MQPNALGSFSLRLFKVNNISDAYISWLNDPEVVKFSNQCLCLITVKHAKFSLTSLMTQMIFLAITHQLKRLSV